MNNAIAKLAQLIDDYMSERDLTVRELAKRAGVSSSSVDNYRKAKVDDPKIYTLAKIAKAMHLELGELLEVCGFTHNDEPRSIFSARELSERIPAEYLPLFQGSNERYIQLADKMRLSEITPEQFEIIIDAFLRVKDK